MRRVILKGTPPENWVKESEKVTQQLRKAADENERTAILKKNEPLWRDDRIRNWLLEQFANKCWYTEAQESVSPVHVDHYRPKGKTRDLSGNETEGYWWLAFDWTNYRISGHLINSKKGDIFPIVEGAKATCHDNASLQLECPLLIDPVQEEARLISYEKEEEGCIAVPAAGIDTYDEYRAAKTIEVLGLNIRDRLTRKRAHYWDQCLLAITEYKSAGGPQVLKNILRVSAINKLKEKIKYEAEFSSVSEACIRKNAPEPLLAEVFGQYQGGVL